MQIKKTLTSEFYVLNACSYLGSRYYNPRESVWLSVDALATYDPFEDENFIDGEHNDGVYNPFNNNPYIYCYQNPVKLTDPNGKQALVGAIVGALSDYGLQVAADYIEGKRGIEAWTNVKTSTILISAGAGAIGVGLATKAEKLVELAKLGAAATKVAKVGATAVVDATVSAGSQYAKTGQVSGKQVLVDVVAGQVGGVMGDKVKAAKQASPEGKYLARRADRATRLSRGGTAKPSRVQRAATAVKKATNYGNNAKTATSSAASNTISGGYEMKRNEKNH